MHTLCVCGVIDMSGFPPRLKQNNNKMSREMSMNCNDNLDKTIKINYYEVEVGLYAYVYRWTSFSIIDETLNILS